MDDKQLILQYLQSHNFMIIATSEMDHSWCSGVYYGVDGDLTLYFMSSNLTRHAKHININQNASLFVGDSAQKFTSKKSGIQMEGTIEIVKENIISKKDEHFEALEIWLKAVGALDGKEIFDLASTKSMVGTLYQFKPKMVRYLNEELFGDYQFKTLTLI